MNDEFVGCADLQERIWARAQQEREEEAMAELLEYEERELAQEARRSIRVGLKTSHFIWR